MNKCILKQINGQINQLMFCCHNNYTMSLGSQSIWRLNVSGSSALPLLCSVTWRIICCGSWESWLGCNNNIKTIYPVVLSLWTDNNWLSKLATKSKRMEARQSDMWKIAHMREENANLNADLGLHLMEWGVFTASVKNTRTILKVT